MRFWLTLLLAALPFFAQPASKPDSLGRDDTREHIVANATLIRTEAVASRAMPLGNLTNMTDAERATLGAWIAGLISGVENIVFVINPVEVVHCGSGLIWKVTGINPLAKPLAGLVACA